MNVLDDVKRDAEAQFHSLLAEMFKEQGDVFWRRVWEFLLRAPWVYRT
jgi:hypothetical protein